MANMLCIQKTERTKLRKLPLLPRFGFTVEIAGRQLTYKQVPFLETLLNAREKGLSVASLLKAAAEALDEVRFPTADGAGDRKKAPLAAVKDLRPKAGKKASAKAASKRRADAPKATPTPET